MPLLRPLILVSSALAVVIVPLMVLGLAFEERVETWLAQDLDAVERFWLLAGVLATDVFLPIPSSAVSTYGGGIIGMPLATLASFVGMTAGALVGYGLAAAFGQGFVRWSAGSGDTERLTRLINRRGPLAIVLTRALPILAEATILLLGATRLPLRKLLPPLLAANLVISLVYAACGEYFRSANALPWAVVATGTVPLLATFVARRYLAGAAQGRLPTGDETP